MEPDKAYILGLLTGGGRISNDVFIVELPFKKWGNDPQRMSIIAGDILTRICQYFRNAYSFDVEYEILTNKWLIKPRAGSVIAPLLADLKQLGLPNHGFLLAKANLSLAKEKLSGISVERFLSGIFDARASLTKSHRRFNNDAPVVSIEIPGSTQNFPFVVQLCSWLTELGSTTDQILYNHPNQHSGSDPDYPGWSKGFKIRFLVKSFLAQHSFALQSKSINITEIKKSQILEEQDPCLQRKIRKPSPITIHKDQCSNKLPLSVRGKVFFHYHHICAVMGCPYAPIDTVQDVVNDSSSLISFFPRLTKGGIDALVTKLNAIRVTYFPDIELVQEETTVARVLENPLLRDFIGIKQGIAFLFSLDLKGKRHVGTMDSILNRSLPDNIGMVTIGSDLNGPILFRNQVNDRAFICSSINCDLNQQLIKTRIVIEDIKVNYLTL